MKKRISVGTRIWEVEAFTTSGLILLRPEDSFLEGVQLVSAKVLAFKNNVPLSFSVQAIWPCGGNLIGYFGFDTEYVNRLEIISEKSHATLNRAFTTPPDFENSIQLNKKNKTYSIECPPADSFVCFLEEVKSSIKIKHFNIWHQKILDDAKTLALLFSATNQEQLVSQL